MFYTPLYALFPLDNAIIMILFTISIIKKVWKCSMSVCFKSLVGLFTSKYIPCLTKYELHIIIHKFYLFYTFAFINS